MSEYRNRTICVDKHEIVVDRVHEIDIFIWQGNVIQVDGLPDEWEYTVSSITIFTHLSTPISLHDIQTHRYSYT